MKKVKSVSKPRKLGPPKTVNPNKKPKLQGYPTFPEQVFPAR